MGRVKRTLVLPYELEREILELTARAFPGFAVTLSTLCKYVQKWCVFKQVSTFCTPMQFFL